MIEAEEQALVEKLVAHAAVETLAEAILHRLSWRNEMPDDPVGPHTGLMSFASCPDGGLASGSRDTRLFNEIRQTSLLDVRETIGQLHRQLTAITRDNPADQPQRSADETLRFARAIKLVVSEESEGTARRVELRLQPARIE